MKPVANATLLAALLVAAGAADAQIYKCKDANGRTITSDRPIPECADRPLQELNKSGVVKREIAAPLTAEEKRQRELDAEKKKAEEAAAKERKRNDEAILAVYRTEADIEKARKRSLDVVQEQLKRDTAALAAAEKSVKPLQAEMDDLAKRKVKAPAGVQHRYDDAMRNVNDTKRRIQDQEAELGKINQKFDETLKRFRELMANVKQ